MLASQRSCKIGIKKCWGSKPLFSEICNVNSEPDPDMSLLVNKFWDSICQNLKIHIQKYGFIILLEDKNCQFLKIPITGYTVLYSKWGIEKNTKGKT